MYQTLFEQNLDGEKASACAPLPENLSVRSKNLKASAYFLDATLAGVCALESTDFISGYPKHTHALIILVEFSREPKSEEPSRQFVWWSAAESGCGAGIGHEALVDIG